MDRLTETLDYLLQEVPRAFVNLVDITKLAEVFRWHQGIQPSPTPEPCPCSGETWGLAGILKQWSYQVSPLGEPGLLTPMGGVAVEENRMDTWEHLLASSKYNRWESFAVVFQSLFFKSAQSPPSEDPPLWDPTTLAVSLWNTMTFLYLSVEKEAGESLSLHLQEQQLPDQIAKEPASVHWLKPADIQVIGAMGDSLTAANGAEARDLPEIVTEYRGLSWRHPPGIHVVKHQPVNILFPYRVNAKDILREFNPSLKGFSVGTGSENTPGAFLNQARAGARSEDLVTQARRLADRMRNDNRIRFQEDWKIITLFIGGNDLCNSCDDPAQYSAENFTENIKTALDLLHAQVPRVFVNLVSAVEIVKLRKIARNSTVGCLEYITSFVCPCVIRFPDDAPEITTLKELNRNYQVKTQELVESGRYDTKEDFTVVVQPFFENLEVPVTSMGLPDRSYFAPDCFHFSKKTHGHAASGLWRNMLEPVGQKTRQHDFQSRISIKCPNENWPFLTTNKNMQGHGTWLSCKDRSPSSVRPTSVHALRPADVQVVAALGDSLTAGNGIGSRPNNMQDVLIQYRGLSYSSGGDGTLFNVTTLPNILREFNGNLTGYAVGTGEASSTNAFLNQAVPGAVARQLTHQVETLVQKMKTDPRVDFHQDWKVITVMIGGGDLCEHCTDLNLYSADNFMSHLSKALDILHKEVPRALVNLVDFMNPSIMRQVFLGNADKCPQQLASTLCNCVLTPRANSPELARMEALSQDYQNNMRKLVDTGRYGTREDFSVVLQPFFQKLRIPTRANGHPDTSFFAPDCIHLSQKFHSQLSRALWVNMLQPLGRKTDTLDLSANIPLTCPTQNEPFLRTSRNSNHTYASGQGWGTDFQCKKGNPSNPVPTSVHKLQPADIKVVAALGDSLTTATGAQPSGFTDTAIPWRGFSWSIGGDGVLENHTTLPNILKKFNPYLFGFSTSTVEDSAGLNVAVEGARAKDMPVQAQNLVTLMKNSPKINLQKDWKLVTLFIGGNDLCHYCENRVTYPAREYIKHIEKALDILYEKLPRVFVNVVEVMDMAVLHQGQRGNCVVLATQSECSCLKHSQNSPEMLELKKVNWNFQSAISRFSYWRQYLQREDFAVVVQPFFRNTLLPLNEKGTADLTFFSKDCFYFSERGHAQMAIALWNNMLEPVGRKTTFNNFSHSRAQLKCPSPENPYLYTLRNSRLLPDQTRKIPKIIYWAVPLAGGAGLLAGAVIMGVVGMRGG
ncbi:PREDICTED: phospholipase B1, membrane-associated [Galeopterus variegatus]|uniref:Phospholipase B1, membrane-associated n=1 Tax=Galeopterus variegatus TaxID=482537 RepID=A0ABM0Q8E0_GALVR|nr:PREDICTED: phospholipase B1, membrane-associated [Galeopterus variegatus]